jgi:hypothetical protein
VNNGQFNGPDQQGKKAGKSLLLPLGHEQQVQGQTQFLNMQDGERSQFRHDQQFW